MQFCFCRRRSNIEYWDEHVAVCMNTLRRRGPGPHNTDVRLHNEDTLNGKYQLRMLNKCPSVYGM